MLNLIKTWRGLSLLADEASANRIINAKVIEVAQARVELFDSKGQHMCLDEFCSQPITGDANLGHCPRHLTTYESRWLTEGLQSTASSSLGGDGSTHSLVREAQHAVELRDAELAKQITERKYQALAQARQVVLTVERDAARRRACLIDR